MGSIDEKYAALFDQDVNAAERVARLADHRARSPSDVTSPATPRARCPAAGERLCRLRGSGDVGDHDGRAVLRESRRQRAADALRAAGYDGRLSRNFMSDSPKTPRSQEAR